jgi:NAD(P)-dependent dehydrogenase (short-subunit alcohol dehydrogenase family)
VRTAIVVGASTGIGLALSRRLTTAGWRVIGLARRASPLVHDQYRHVIADVRAPGYRELLAAAFERAPDLCVYAAGIGLEIELSSMSHEADVIATNLLGAVITAEVVIPRMIEARAGHLIGISSQADRLIDAYAPSYAASKAGLSSYLEGLALASRAHGVAITNVRLGFVDTAMAKSPGPRPFLVSADRAAQIIERCITTRPIRRTFPLRMACVLWLVRWGSRLRVWAS